MSSKKAVAARAQCLRRIAQKFHSKGERWEWHSHFFENYAQALEGRYDVLPEVPKAKQFATFPVKFVEVDAPAEAALSCLLDNHIDQLPVVEKNGSEKVVGLLTKDDFVEYRESNGHSDRVVRDILNPDSKLRVGELELEASLADALEQFDRGKMAVLLIEPETAEMKAILTKGDYLEYERYRILERGLARPLLSNL